MFNVVKLFPGVSQRNWKVITLNVAFPRKLQFPNDYRSGVNELKTGIIYETFFSIVNLLHGYWFVKLEDYFLGNVKVILTNIKKTAYPWKYLRLLRQLLHINGQSYVINWNQLRVFDFINVLIKAKAATITIPSPIAPNGMP